MEKNNLSDNSFFGVLNDISLVDYIQLICIKKATKAIRVTQQDKKGLILIHDGKILYAIQNELLGLDAFHHIMSWKSGSFREVKINKNPTPNIDKDYRLLLFETADKTDEASSKPASIYQAEQILASPESESIAGDNLPLAGHGQNHTGKKVTIKDADKRSTQPALYKKVRKRTIIGLSVFLPFLIALILLQTFNLLDTLQLAAFATNSFPVSAKTSTDERNKNITEEYAKPTVVEVVHTAVALTPPNVSTERNILSENEGEKLETVFGSISIGSLIKSDIAEILPQKTILRLHGSNTIGAKLAPALVKRYLLTKLGAENVEQVAGENENEVYLKAKFNDRIEVVEIHAHGSSTGFKDMAADKCDIAMASRKIKDKEVVTLQGFGEMTAVTNEHVIALDGIAVIVNKSNTINQMDVQLLADIFSGKISNWSEQSGKPGNINVYARDNNSGTFDTFKSIILGENNVLKPETRRFESNPELSEQVANDPNGIGFTSLPNILKSKAIAIADAGAKEVYPSFFTVATEDYPISRRLYLYTATNPGNPHVRDFVEFVHSVQGQEVVNNIGLVDMNIKSFYADKTDTSQIKNLDQIQEYLNATDNAQRLSLNFRFTSEKTILDNRSVRDLDRVVDFLKDKLERKIVLAGFADNSGDYEFNLNLSRERAETVADLMRARGVFTDRIYSCGEELPVATNLSASGREKNRRVEVWLK